MLVQMLTYRHCSPSCTLENSLCIHLIKGPLRCCGSWTERCLHVDSRGYVDHSGSVECCRSLIVLEELLLPLLLGLLLVSELALTEVLLSP